MSILYSIISYSASLIAEPFLSFFAGIYTKEILNDPVLLAKERNKENLVLQSYKKIEGVALEQINLFLSDLGVQPGAITTRESNIIEFAMATGSLKDEAIAAVVLSPEITEEIQTNFTLEHKFLIAHEVGHLVHDDVDITSLLIANKSCRYSLIAFAISLYPFGLLTNSILVNYIFSCTVAKVARLLVRCNLKHTMEFKADSWAAQQSYEIAQAGITWCKKTDKYWSESLKIAFENRIALSKNSPSMLEKVSLKAKAYYIKFYLIAHERAISFHMSHPHFKARIAAISKKL